MATKCQNLYKVLYHMRVKRNQPSKQKDEQIRLFHTSRELLLTVYWCLLFIYVYVVLYMPFIAYPFMHSSLFAISPESSVLFHLSLSESSMVDSTLQFIKIYPRVFGDSRLTLHYVQISFSMSSNPYLMLKTNEQIGNSV